MGCYEWSWCHCYILGGARSQQGSSGPSKYTSTTYDNDDDDDDVDDDCVYAFVIMSICISICMSIYV